MPIFSRIANDHCRCVDGVMTTVIWRRTSEEEPNFMKHAYHIHTYLCQHADGPIRAYVENAVKMGYTQIAFSDHSPQFYPNGFVSGIRMRIDQVDDYIGQLTALRTEFADQIDIKIGFEAEYYPAMFDQLCALCEEKHVDFLFMGQHYTSNEVDRAARSAWNLGSDPAGIFQYADQVIAGLQTGWFCMLAHPDVPNYTGPREAYEQAMHSICLAAKELQIPLEYNLQGFRYHRHYPCARFFQIAAEVGNIVTIGIDAHTSQDLLDVDVVQQAERQLAAWGLHVTEPIPLFLHRR